MEKQTVNTAVIRNRLEQLESFNDKARFSPEWWAIEYERLQNYYDWLLTEVMEKPLIHIDVRDVFQWSSMNGGSMYILKDWKDKLSSTVSTTTPLVP